MITPHIRIQIFNSNFQPTLHTLKGFLMSNQLITLPTTTNSEDGLTFSSRMIAEKTDKLHKNVCRDIRNMFDKLEITGLTFERSYKDSSGKANIEYLLPERYLMNVLMSYSVELRDAVITEVYRLKEENAQLKQQVQPSLPNFSNPAEAARAWANEYEQKQIAEHKVEVLTPLANVGQRAVSNKRTIPEVARLLDGVNTQKVLRKLVDLKYLYERKGDGKKMPYAKYNKLFELRYTDNEQGHTKVVATDRGQTLLVQLYNDNKLPMKIGCKVVHMELPA